jgi:hypothetical protein
MNNVAFFNIAMYLSEFVDEKQYEKYIKTFKHDGVTILWENKEKHCVIVPNNSKSKTVLNKLQNE